MSAAEVVSGSAMTAEDLLGLPDDGTRHELVRGELRTMSPSGYRHVRIAARVVSFLYVYATEHGLGDVLSSEGGFLLGRGPDTVRGPDAAFVRADRVPSRDDDAGFAELAPDLVVEVVSPNDRWTDVTEKAVMWLDAGVRLVWVVDPAKQIVVVHSPKGGEHLRGDAVLDGEDVLPGFRLPLTDLFA